MNDDCHPDAEQLAEYADGVLSDGVRAEVEAHLVNCPDCRNVLAETLAFVTVQGDSIQTSVAGLGSRVWRFRSRRWFAAVAAAFAAAARVVERVRRSRPVDGGPDCGGEG